MRSEKHQFEVKNLFSLLHLLFCTLPEYLTTLTCDFRVSMLQADYQGWLSNELGGLSNGHAEVSAQIRQLWVCLLVNQIAFATRVIAWKVHADIRTRRFFRMIVEISHFCTRGTTTTSGRHAFTEMGKIHYLLHAAIGFLEKNRFQNSSNVIYGRNYFCRIHLIQSKFCNIILAVPKCRYPYP